MKNLFRKIYGHIALLYLLPLLIFIATELEWVPSHFICEPIHLYLWDIAAISNLLCGAYFSLMLFTFKRPQSSFAAAKEEAKQRHTYYRWVMIREYILWACISLCTLAYCLTYHSDTALFSLLILLLVRLYVFPTKKEFRRIFPS